MSVGPVHEHDVRDVQDLHHEIQPIVVGAREQTIRGDDGSVAKVIRYRDAGLTVDFVLTPTRNADGTLSSYRIDVYDDAGSTVVRSLTYTVVQNSDGSFAYEDVS